MGPGVYRGTLVPARAVVSRVAGIRGSQLQWFVNNDMGRCIGGVVATRVDRFVTPLDALFVGGAPGVYGYEVACCCYGIGY